MVADKLRAAWASPRPPDAPGPAWRDWLLVGGLIVASILEALVRTDLVWPWVSLAVALPMVLALPWRRRFPLLAVLGVFGPILVADVTGAALGVDWEGLYSLIVVLLLIYALGRWGSGREIAIGGAVVLGVASVGIVTDSPNTVGDIIGGYLILLFTVEIGIIVRSQASAHATALEQARLRERELLARELHDTVAHHVSAIAIQAQAGRTLASSDPDVAATTLRAIEEEASRTLTEMRGMVSALRQDEQAAYAPQPGIDDIRRLADATDAGNGVRVDVELTGDLDHLRPAVGTALFRLAQESVTNALRHAHHATCVAVRVHGGDHAVRLTVDDDGDGPTGGDRAAPGYGLVGMQERAALLGGTLEAGPGHERGWSVQAVLPRHDAP